MMLILLMFRWRMGDEIYNLGEAGVAVYLGVEDCVHCYGGHVDVDVMVMMYIGHLW